MTIEMESTYHHGKSQWFVKGVVPSGSAGNGFVYGTDGQGKKMTQDCTNCTSTCNFQSALVQLCEGTFDRVMPKIFSRPSVELK